MKIGSDRHVKKGRRICIPSGVIAAGHFMFRASWGRRLLEDRSSRWNLHRQPCFSLLTRAASSRASTCQSMVAQFPDNPPRAQFRLIEPSENTTL
jgi:hypothetical protein